MAKILAQTVTNGVTITKYAPGVAVGLKKTDYLPADHGGFGGKTATPITTDDPKYDMYANALPAAIRQGVVAQKLDARAIYKEYRKMGKDALVAKYQYLI